MRRVILFIFSERAVCGGWGGGGGMLPDFLFCSLFPVQQTTSGISHRVKQFFRVGNQYAECRNNDRENNAINDNDDRENREHS